MKKEWKMPNGDDLVTAYDGDNLVITVSSGGSQVYKKTISNRVLTGDPAYVKDVVQEKPHYIPRTGRFATGVHLGPDED